MKITTLVTRTALCLSMMLAAQAGLAADVKLVTVAKKFDKGMEPTGTKLDTPAGAFLVIPKLDLSEVYDDNIYATENNAKHDLITRIRPSVEVRQDTKTRYISALARLDVNRNAAKKEESTAGYLASLYGVQDLSDATTINGKLSYSREFEDRGDPNSPFNAAKPIAYNYGLARAGITHDFGSGIDAKASTEMQTFDYLNSYTNAGGFIDSDARDRNHYVQTLQARYKLNDTFSPFVRGVLDNRVYDRKAPANRTSTGGSAVAGSDVNWSSTVKGSAFAGMLSRDYSGASFKDIKSPTYGGNVTWNVDPTLSVLGSITRSVEETTRAASSGIMETVYALDAEKKLCEELLLTSGVAFTVDSYKGNAANQRHDKYWDGYAGLKHYLTKATSISGEYSYRQRESNISGGDYDNNQLMVKLSLSY